jgi:hypothetical protein
MLGVHTTGVHHSAIFVPVKVVYNNPKNDSSQILRLAAFLMDFDIFLSEGWKDVPPLNFGELQRSDCFSGKSRAGQDGLIIV